MGAEAGFTPAVSAKEAQPGEILEELVGWVLRDIEVLSSRSTAETRPRSKAYASTSR